MPVSDYNLPESRLFTAVLNQVFMDLTSNNKELIREAKEYIDTEGFNEVCDLLAIDPKITTEKLLNGTCSCLMCGKVIQRSVNRLRVVKFFCSDKCSSSTRHNRNRTGANVIIDDQRYLKPARHFLYMGDTYE